MNELIDKSLFKLFEGLHQKIYILFDVFIADAQALTACFMLLYFGMESFKMMTGDKEVEIMPLLRPFALGLLIIFWVPFIRVLDDPAQYITDTSKGMFYSQLDEVEMLSRKRFALVDSVSTSLMIKSKEAEQAEEEMNDSKWWEFGIDLDAIGDKIMGGFLYVTGQIKRIVFDIIEFLVVTFWQACIYFVFFIQIIFLGILSILGPLSIAFSILPAFRDAWTQWLARYISVSIYTCIAYIVLSIALVIQQYALEKEIEILTQSLSNEAAFVMFATMSSGGSSTFIVTCLIGAVSMLTIPFVSTWIIQTTGAGHAIAGMVGGAMAITKGAGKAASGA